MNLSDAFKSKAIFTSDNLSTDSTVFNAQHLENEQLRNAFSQPQQSVSGFSVNQSEDKRDQSNDSNDKQKRKLTR